MVGMEDVARHLVLATVRADQSSVPASAMASVIRGDIEGLAALTISLVEYEANLTVETSNLLLEGTRTRLSCHRRHYPLPALRSAPNLIRGRDCYNAIIPLSSSGPVGKTWGSLNLSFPERPTRR